MKTLPIRSWDDFNISSGSITNVGGMSFGTMFPEEKKSVNSVVVVLFTVNLKQIKAVSFKEKEM